MKKKWITVMIATCLSFMTMGILSACVNENSTQSNSSPCIPEEIENQLEYKFDNSKNGYIVTGIGNYTEISLEIPTTYNNIPVLEIADGAFFKNNSIVEVHIPDGIQRIGECAFYKCENLKRLSIGKDVEDIGSFAFYECQKVQTLYYTANAKLGETVFQSLGAQACANDAFTLQITFGKNVQEIEPYAFKNIYANSVNFEENSQCVWISPCAFYDSSITEVRLPDSLTLIGTEAFYSCDTLKAVSIPANVNTISKGAFQFCTRLETVTFAENSKLQKIGANAFQNCIFSGIDLPDSLMKIEREAFSFCSNLVEIVIPDSVQGTIGDNAFYYCNSLQSVTIGNGVTEIGKSAFQYCLNLENVILGNAVVFIHKEAFAATGKILELRIPASVKYIFEFAFQGAGLIHVYFDSPEAWVGAKISVTLTLDDISNSNKMAMWLNQDYSQYNWVKPNKNNDSI